MEMVQLSGLSAVYSQGFAAVKKCSDNYGPEDLELGAEADTLRSQTFNWNLLKAWLALPILHLTSLSVLT